MRNFYQVEGIHGFSEVVVAESCEQAGMIGFDVAYEQGRRLQRIRVYEMAIPEKTGLVYVKAKPILVRKSGDGVEVYEI